MKQFTGPDPPLCRHAAPDPAELLPYQRPLMNLSNQFQSQTIMSSAFAGQRGPARGGWWGSGS